MKASKSDVISILVVATLFVWLLLITGCSQRITTSNKLKCYTFRK